MSQEHIWEKEYRRPQLLSRENKPQTDIFRYVKDLRKSLKKEGRNFLDYAVLDVGSGTGRNSLYFAELGAHVVGLEISDTALSLAKTYTSEAQRSAGVDASPLTVEYIKQDIGKTFPVDSGQFDLALDITSSNSLDEAGREVCVQEIHRALKTDGLLLLKTLCKDADENAQHLIKTSPGPEKDTYVLPGLGLVERVWTRKDLVDFYGRYFTIVSIEKKTSYMAMLGRSYKRNFWIVEMQKKA